jgi:hypothetical protein
MATGKLAAEEKESSGGNDDQKDHKYGNDCRITATTVIIRHKIDPLSCSDESLFGGDVIV